MQAARPVLAIALVVTLNAGLATGQFLNDLDQEFQFECSDGQMLKSLYSVHDNSAEDRQWRLNCSDAPAKAALTSCLWAYYISSWDEPMSFMCPSDYAVAGIQSQHSNVREDRRFRFRCCNHPGYTASSCSMTPYINQWDGELDYTVPSGKVLVGVASIHRNDKEDRRFQFIVCNYGNLVPSE